MNSAQRPRAKLPGGSGQAPTDCRASRGPRAPPYGPARRVSFSELLGGVASLPPRVLGEHLPTAGRPVGKDCQARDIHNNGIPAEFLERRLISLRASAPNDTAKYLVACPWGSGITYPFFLALIVASRRMY